MKFPLIQKEKKEKKVVWGQSRDGLCFGHSPFAARPRLNQALWEVLGLPPRKKMPSVPQGHSPVGEMQNPQDGYGVGGGRSAAGPPRRGAA